MAGIVLAVVGVAVLVIAVIALRDPKNPSSPHAAGTVTRTTTTTGTPTTGGSSGSSGPGSPSSGAPDTSITGSSSSGDSKPTVAQYKADFPLIVLNNTTTSGLAEQAAQRFENGGWKVTSFGNLDNTIISTCAYYDPSVQHAKGAAKELQREYPTIQRVEPRFDGLDSGPVVVVLTPDYSSG